MKRTRRVTILAAVLITALLAVAIPFGIHQIQSATGVSTVASVDPADYPAFTAKYLETTPENGTLVSRTWKVDYNNQRDWQKEEVSVTGLTDNLRRAFEVGTVWQFHGTTLSIKHANVDKPITVEHPEGFVPFSWLHAGRLSYLKNAGAPIQVTRDANGQQQVIYGNVGSPRTDLYTLNPRGVPIDGDIHATGDIQFKALSFTFK